MRYEGLKMNKRTRNTVFGIMIFCLSLGQSAVFGQDKESLSRGAVILADKTEPVTFFDENNQPLAKTTTIPGYFCPSVQACKPEPEEERCSCSVTERWSP